MPNGRDPRRYRGTSYEESEFGPELRADPSERHAYAHREPAPPTDQMRIDRAIEMGEGGFLTDILRNRHDLEDRRPAPGDTSVGPESERAYWSRVFGTLPMEQQQTICSQAKCTRPADSMSFSIKPLCEICSRI
jgi:hypothetical protein